MVGTIGDWRYENEEHQQQTKVVQSFTIRAQQLTCCDLTLRWWRPEN